VGGLAFYFAYRHWYLPRRSWRDVERLRREGEAGVPPSPRDYHYAISFDSTGFTVVDLRGERQESVSMRWAEVRRATAFKRDLFAIDCICLFLARAGDTGIEVDEEMARWRSFVEALPHHLTGCKPSSEWYGTVAFPAFVQNEIHIYERTEVAQPITKADAS
jgi:hypothetical protein